jgi:hypothetical protein
MQNSRKSEKSKGVVVFAFNTSVDYVAIADNTSKLIERNLKLPITLITDHDAEPQFEYDQVIRVDVASGNIKLDVSYQQVEWKNFGRYLAYELSPYDSTVLLDVDYLVLDDSLLKLIDLNKDYAFHYYSSSSNGDLYSSMGPYSLPFIWATVIVFNKSDKTKMLFDLVKRIQDNYDYYCKLYNIRERNFRNDYAFAIANIILNGYHIDPGHNIPWKMFTITDKVDRLIVDSKNIRAYFTNKKPILMPQQNIHVMDKAYLQSTQFKDFVTDVTG